MRGWHAVSSDCFVGSGRSAGPVILARQTVFCGDMDYLRQVRHEVDRSFVEDVMPGSTRFVGALDDFRFDLTFSAGTTGPHVGFGYEVNCSDGKPVGKYSVPGPPQDVVGEVWSVPIGAMYEAVIAVGPTACIHR